MAAYKTPQKKMVADFFEKNRSGEYSVADVAKMLDGKVGLSSIYRIIASLEADGVLRKFYREGKRQLVYRHFDRDNCNSHLHLKCTECGEVYHMPPESTKAISKVIGDGFVLQNEHTTLFGLCKSCNKVDE